MALLSIWRTVLKLRRPRACFCYGAHAPLKLSENQPKVQFRSILRQQTMLLGCSVMLQRELELDANGVTTAVAHLMSNPGYPTHPVRIAACAKTMAVALVPALAMVAVVINAQPIPAPKCAIRLSVEVTPDVPNPGDGGFLSSLLGNHTEYQLFLLRLVDDTHVDLQLQGPGPDDRCRAVVDSMRDDGRVLSIDTT